MLRYTAITGVPAFVKAALEFAYGPDSEAIKSGRIAASQSISGTGGCRLAAEMVKTFFGKVKVYIPDPTWANHVALFRTAGLEPVYYKYYDPATKGVDFDGLVSDIRNAEDGSMFMLHACAHNPTGCDPTTAQWDQLSQLMLEKQHVVFFDCAYQGFASGDAEADAYAIRKFVADGHAVMLSQSFAKVSYRFECSIVFSLSLLPICDTELWPVR
jgi:aspartate aminotransferase